MQDAPLSGKSANLSMDKKKKLTIKKRISLEKKSPPEPKLKEKKFIETLEGQVLKQIGKSLENRHFIEAYVLSWATIEQVLLPRLMKFIAERLRINLPKQIWNLNQYVFNQVYYCISHDKDLFNKLEKGRKLRNEVIHEMYTQDSLRSIQKKSLKALEYNNKKLILPIIDRLSGKKIIPSLTLYARGWNDAGKEVNSRIERIKKELGL